MAEPEDRLAVWIKKARHDLVAALRLHSSDDDLSDLVAYHCQQSVEKALKACLVSRGLDVPRTHDLLFLLDRCIGAGFDLGSLLDDVSALNPHGVHARYPSDLPGPTREIANLCVDAAQRACEAILSSLGGGTGSG